MARGGTVTPGEPIARIPGSGRDLLRSVMAGIRDRFDLPLATWARREGLDRDVLRAGLLGASSRPEAIESARVAMRAAGLEVE